MENLLKTSKENIINCQNSFKNSFKLNDIDILLFLYIFKEFYFNYPNSFIDSQSTSIIDNIFKTKENKELKNQRKLNSYLNHFKGDQLFVTIPLFFQNHWSLAILIKKFNIILHFDSIQGYHKNSINQLVIYLLELGVEIKQLIFIKTPIQKGSWECGYYLLMFNYLFLLVYHERNDDAENENDFIERIEDKLTQYQQINGFKETLLKTLDVILIYNFY
jgi:Ulp1 family protease